MGEAVPQAGWRVLIIEDDPMNRELVTAILEPDGYTVLSAETAPAGIELAISQQPDIILTDVQLPGLSGYEATRQLKADPRTAHIPIVALTAQAMRGEDGRARAAGCDVYLPKPLDAPILREVLARILGT